MSKTLPFLPRLGTSLLALSLFFPAGTALSAPAPRGKITLVIFHTNDIHGRVQNFAKIHALVARERKINPHVLLLSVGDNFSGNPIVDQAVPRGEPILKLMNRLGYDAMALGNHDFDFGQPVLARFIRKASFPVISANTDSSATPLKKILPEVTLKVGKLRIALCGLIQTEKGSGLPSTLPERVEGVRFSDAIDTAKKLSPLRRKADLGIVLSHLGVEADHRLASEVPGIDLIVGGHSHTLIREPQSVNGVLIAQAGGNGDFLGRIEVTFQDGKIVEKRGTLIDLRQETAETPDIRAMIEKFEANPHLNRVIKNLARPLTGKNELGSLMADAVLKVLNLDVVFQNSGGVRLDELRDPVRVRDIYQLHPFENDIVVYRLTPDEIRGLIRYDYSRRNQLDLLPAGLSYTVRVDAAGEAREVVLKRLEGKEFVESQPYSVGVNNYIASTYQFPHRDPGQGVHVSVAGLILQYLGSGADLSGYTGTVRARTELVSGGAPAETNQGPLEIGAGSDPFAGSNSAGNLMADALAAATGASIALYPSRLLRTGISFKSGAPITLEVTPRLYAFSDRNRVVTGKISGRDLEAFLLKRMQFKNNADLQVSGITVRAIRNAKGEIGSVALTLRGGAPLVPETDYWVAFDLYDFDRHYHLGDQVRNRVMSSKTEREMLSEYLKTIGTVPPSVGDPRIEFVSTTEVHP